MRDVSFHGCFGTPYAHEWGNKPDTTNGQKESINEKDADGNVMQYFHLIPAGRLAKKPIDGNLHGSFISTIFHMNEHDDDLLVVFEPSGFALSLTLDF